MSLTTTIAGVSMEGDAHFIERTSYRLTDQLGQRNTLSFVVVSKDGSYRPVVGSQVLSTHSELGDQFGGTIRNLKTELYGSGALVSYCDCASWEAIMDQRLCGQRTWAGNNAGDIFTRILLDYCNDENLTSSIVVAGPALDSFAVDFCTVREAFDKLCELSSTGDDTYSWDVTPARVVRFYKQTSFHAPLDITDSTAYVLRPISVSSTFDEYGNRVYVRLSRYVTDEQTQAFNPDGSQRVFAVDKPIAKVPTIYLSDPTRAQQTVGIKDVDTGKQWYWQDGSPNVWQDETQTIPSATSTLEVTFHGYQSRVIDGGQNADAVTERSIAEGGSGWHMKLLESDTGTTSTDALSVATAWLDKHSGIPTIYEYPCTFGGIKAGMWQHITSSKFGVTIHSDFIVESSVLGFDRANGGWCWQIRAVDGALLGDWKTKLRKIATGGKVSATGGGASTASAYPAAPNVTAATFTVHYESIGGIEQWYGSGDITLPTSDSDYAHLKRIHISIAGLPELKVIDAVDFAPDPSTHKIPFSTIDIPRETTQQTYDVEFRVENEDGAITTNPYTISGVVVSAGAGLPGTTPLAPKITAATGSVVYSLPNNEAVFQFDGTVTLPYAHADYAHLREISIIARCFVSSGKYINTEIARLSSLTWSPDVNHQITFRSQEFKQAATVASWDLRFQSINEDGKPNPDILVVTVAVQAAKVNSVSASAGAKITTGADRGVQVPIVITPVLNGSQVPQNVTIWLNDGTLTWINWYRLDSVGQTITIYRPAPDASSPTWTIWAEAGAIGSSSQPSAYAQSCTVSVSQIIAPTSLWVSGSTVSGSYVPSGGGAYSLKFSVSATVPLSNAELWFARLTAQKYVTATGLPSSDAEGTEFNVIDVGPDPKAACVTVSGNSVTIQSDPWAVAPVGYTYRLRWYATSRRNAPGGTTQLQSAWTGGSSYSDIVCDPEKGKFGADTINTNTIDGTLTVSGGRLMVNAGTRIGRDGSGRLSVVTNTAPAPVSVTVPTIRSTSGGTLAAVGGLPAWNADLTITLNTGSSDFARTKELVVSLLESSVVKYPPVTITSWTLNGSGQFTYTLPTEFQDSSTHTLTASVVARNEDSVASSAATVQFTVPSASTGGSQPLCPPIQTASATALWEHYGHLWNVGISGSFTPTDNSGLLASSIKFVRVNKVKGSQRTEIETKYGPFVAGTPVTFAGPADALITASTTWTVEFVAVNGDNIPASVYSVNVTTAPNVITGVTASEVTAKRFIEPGGGAKTYIQIAPTITTTNGPGFWQTCAFWYSTDGQVTWQSLGWRDVASSGQNWQFEVWRPTDADKTCYAAVAMWDVNDQNGYPGAVISSLPFTLSRVGAPLASDVSNAIVKARTATGSYLWPVGDPNGIVLQKNTDAAGNTMIYWGLPDGIQWANPSFGADPNFQCTVLTAQCVDVGGIAAPTEQGGVESIVGMWDGAGTQLCTSVEMWEFNPVGSTYTYMRFRLYCLSRSASGWQDTTYRTLQTSAWSGAAYKDVHFGDAPPSGILSGGTAPTVPAPSSVTAIFADTQQNGAPYFIPSGNVNLNTGGTNYSSTRGIKVVISELNQIVSLQSFAAPSATIAWTGPPIPKASVATTYTVQAWALNGDGVPAGPVSTSLAVTAAGGPMVPATGTVVVSSVTLAEVGTRRRGTGGDFTTHATLRASVNMQANYGPQNVTVYYSSDNGANFYWTGWYQVPQVGSVDLDKVAPAATQYVQVAVVPGAIGGNPNVSIAVASLPANKVLSNVLTFSAIGAPTSNAITTASTTGVTGPTTDPRGNQNWYIANITWTDNSTIDPNAKSVELRGFCCDSGGNAAPAVQGGTDVLIGMWDVDGTTHSCGTVKWWGYNPAGSTYTYFQFYLKVFSASGLSAVQNCWGGAAYTRVNFGSGNGFATGTSNMGPGVSPSGGGIVVDSSGSPVVATGGSSSMFWDWDFELSPAGQLSAANQSQWSWGGYGGTSQVITSGGAYSGSKFCRLTGPYSNVCQTVSLPTKEAIYISVAARGGPNMGGTHQVVLVVTVIFNDGSSADDYSTVFNGTGSWVANALTKVIVPSANAAKLQVKIAADSGISYSGYFDIDSVIVRPVSQQTTNNQTASMVPTSNTAGGVADTTALRITPYSGADVSHSEYGRKICQLYGYDGVAWAAMYCAPYGGGFEGTVAVYDSSAHLTGMNARQFFCQGSGGFDGQVPAGRAINVKGGIITGYV